MKKMRVIAEKHWLGRLPPWAESVLEQGWEEPDQDGMREVRTVGLDSVMMTAQAGVSKVLNSPEARKRGSGFSPAQMADTLRWTLHGSM